MRVYIYESSSIIKIRIYLCSQICLQTIIEGIPPHTVIQSNFATGNESEETNQPTTIFYLTNYLQPFNNASNEVNKYIITISFLADIYFNSLRQVGRTSMN